MVANPEPSILRPQPAIVRKAIRHLRKQLKMSQAEFSALVGIAQQTLSKFEHGKKDLSPETIDRIINAAGEAKRKRQVEAAVSNAFGSVAPFLGVSQPESISASAESAKLSEENVRSLMFPQINQFVTQIEYWKELTQSQARVISDREKQMSDQQKQIADLKARVTELEQELARKRTKKGEATNG
jgi:transcriptional regulator with XRE-family HTH domain